jgi:beta-galactosidase
VFKDFSTPIRPDNPVPYMNQKGLVERDLTKKEAYYVFQSYWATQPMAHIYGHSMPVRWGQEGEEKMVKVYSNCDEAELFVNGKSQGRKKRSSADFPAAGLRWNVAFPKGNNEVRVAAVKGKTTVHDTITFRYQTETWGKPAKMALQKTVATGNIVTLEVKLLDDKGIQCLDAADFVRFSLAGDGRLLDNLGTSSGARLVQLYNGRAIIRVDTAGKGGVSAVAVKCEGVPTVTLNL